MTREQLNRAWQIAKQMHNSGIPYNLDWAIGFKLSDYETRYVTIEAIADLIRYQCATMAGTWDMDAFNEIAQHGKQKFLVVE